MRAFYATVADRIAAAARAQGPGFVVGVSGPQGSGKTTAVNAMTDLVAARGLSVAKLALDDLYLPLEARRRLAAEVHPLLLTRGVPGTHDVDLGVRILDCLTKGGAIDIPRFDKATDDRSPMVWMHSGPPMDVILFEGWCVGARPQGPSALREPVNALERERDPQGVWRAYVNAALAGPYQDLFAPIDLLVLLQPPGFEMVLRWRQQQERQLRAASPGGGMSDAELSVFVQHYERLTRHIQAEMPVRADIVVKLAADRQVEGVDFRA
jgi:D-glycerate 3-kinase